jgi:hypothetical protein
VPVYSAFVGSIKFDYPKPDDAYAILVEGKRINGKPRQRHVAYLGLVRLKPEYSPHYRAWWWRRMNAKLDRLATVLTPADRTKIDAALAVKVPKVSPEEIIAYDREYTQHMHTTRNVPLDKPGCYLEWPKGTEGLPPRPEFKKEPFAGPIAAIRQTEGK